jgi:zinc protease
MLSLPSPPSAALAPLVLAGGAVQYRLPNGLTLLIKPDRRAPTAVHMLWVRAGAMDEVDGMSGVAHVLEHMMFKGSERLAPGAFSRQVAALGGRENAFTSRDFTGYFQQIPAHRLADVMTLEADRFANNRWSDDEFRRELEVVKEERRMRTDDQPRAQLHEQLMATAFIASPYRRPVVGWMSDLESMQPDDVRAFYRRWYRPSQAAVVVAGDVDVQQVVALALKHYGPLVDQAVEPSRPRTEPEQKGVRRLSFKATAEQPYVALAFKVPGLTRELSDPVSQDALALLLLSAVLDGYAGARLDRALTQGVNRVADAAGSSYSPAGRGPALFVLDGVPIDGGAVSAVEQGLRAQIRAVAHDGVSAAELVRVKNQWTAAEVYKLDSVMNQARELGSWWAMGFPADRAATLVAALRAVTAEQVQSVAARYFGDDALTIAELVPQPPDPNRPQRRLATGLRH